MSKKRVIRCAACTRRIRDHHPYIGLERYDTGREVAYHARDACQEAGAEQLAQMMKVGRIYVIHHYHVCGDEAGGFDCSGGCFSGQMALGRN